MYYIYKLTRLIFTGIFFILSIQKSQAQKDSTFTQKITKEFCVEFSKKDFSEFKGFEMELGLLIVPIIEKYSKEIEKEWGLLRDNEQDYEKISEKIGQEAARGCPKFLEFVKNNLSEIKESTDEDETKSITGTFQRIEEQLFCSLVIKTKAGKEEKLWWFQFFEGADELIKTPAMLAKKNITVRYSEMEVYDSKLKEYRAIKVIKSLTAN
jgi:hypothetical protein